MTKQIPIDEVIFITDHLSEDEWKKISKTEESINVFLEKYGWTLKDFEIEFATRGLFLE